MIHFAALKSVAESFEMRDEYFSVNVGGTENLIRIMERHGVRRLVFSSSAATYGLPEQNPIPETAELRPTNPYGESKVACEELLTAHAAKHLNWSIVMLRYFNPVGSHDSALLGEFPKNAANIAAIIMEVLRGVRDEVKINGIDYETPDKTCIRDYIHIVDLATAHLAALEWTTKHLGEVIYNVGTGRGYSVKEILAAFATAAGQEIKTSVGPRRIGDVEIVVADANKIHNELGWRAKYGLQEIAASAVAWVKKNPNGFDD
ncbi:MAG: UDP-glucose 4-epimerase GalE [Candidatus Magasanikbacteria bacterium]|nr:UDP-glucose 4-epimerase GalE [Candidatus Magasanikbacteria bacterium]